MIDLIKAHKSLAISLISTVFIVCVLGYLTLVKRTKASDYEAQLTEQVDALTGIHEKEFSVDQKALKIAKANREAVELEYQGLVKELSVYNVPLIKMTATRFKAMLQDRLIEIGVKVKEAGIEVNRTRIPSFSVKNLTDKKESSYIESDFTKGSQKIAIITRLADVLVDSKISKIDFLSWHEVKADEEKPFVTALDFELTIMGNQESIERTITNLSSDQRVLFFVKAIECQNTSTVTKPVISKGKEVDLSSKESRVIKIDNQLTCKLYVKVLQFNIVDSK